MSPSGFDCSGLVAYVYAQIGISLPHHAASQWNYGVPVSYDDLQSADLVFFSGLGHMGMYIGGGQFIHAPHTGDVVRIAYMSERSGRLRRRPPHPLARERCAENRARPSGFDDEGTQSRTELSRRRADSGRTLAGADAYRAKTVRKQSVARS